MKTERRSEEFMREAIREAEEAFSSGEIPVGCVIVKDGEIIARAHNRSEQEKNPMRHAETEAMSSAIKVVGKYLDKCEMYVTLEPCAMCAGAMLNCRLGKLYYGAREPKTGCIDSNYALLSDDRFNWQTEVVGGIAEEECSEILRKFFDERRKKC